MPMMHVARDVSSAACILGIRMRAAMKILSGLDRGLRMFFGMRLRPRPAVEHRRQQQQQQQLLLLLLQTMAEAKRIGAFTCPPRV